MHLSSKDMCFDSLTLGAHYVSFIFFLTVLQQNNTMANTCYRQALSGTEKRARLKREYLQQLN